MYRLLIGLVAITLGFYLFNQNLLGDPKKNHNVMGEDWVFEAQREALAPAHEIDAQNTYQGTSTYLLSGDGKEHVNGQWTRTVAVEAGEAVQFEVFYQADNVEEAHRSILSRIVWLTDEGRPAGRPEYPAVTGKQEGNQWGQMRQVYMVPGEVTKAKIELIYRWDPDGSVRFGGCSLKPAPKPTPRMVRVASIHHRPVNTSSARENLDQFAELIEVAAEKGADIVCLPEGATMAGTRMNYIEASEPVPGPTTEYLGQLSRKHKMYIVAGILEREGEVVYNTAVLMDREGNVAGKYRKVCLPREEIVGGVTPGDALPVFQTDFGTIGILICWDITFPETARTLAMKGAELILLPIWGGNLTLTRARAIENQVYIVSSTYDMKTAVFDQEGEIIVEASEDDPVIVADIDLNQQKLWPWLGDFKNRIPREMPTSRALEL